MIYIPSWMEILHVNNQGIICGKCNMTATEIIGNTATKVQYSNGEFILATYIPNMFLTYDSLETVFPIKLPKEHDYKNRYLDRMFRIVTGDAQLYTEYILEQLLTRGKYDYKYGEKGEEDI